MDLPQPPPHGSDPIITQFKPVRNQWELTEDNIKRTDPETGRTILHNYCQHIKTTPLGVYRYLIETQGCDVNVQNKYNNTPIQRALFYFDPRTGGDITVLTYLLNQNSVNLNIKGRSGHTLLHYACEQINYLPLEIFKMLIETMGCDVNAQDNDKNTPIHCAFQKFDPNQGGGDGITVLLYLLGHEDANVNIKNEKGCNLLHFTCINNFADIDDSAELNGEYDTVLCQVVEFITERWIQLILDETTP